MIFYSSRSHPPQKFHCSSRIPSVSDNLQRPGLKSDIRKTPPPLLEAQKHVGGVYFTWLGQIFLKKNLALPPPNIPGLKGGDRIIWPYRTIIGHNMSYPITVYPNFSSYIQYGSGREWDIIGYDNEYGGAMRYNRI